MQAEWIAREIKLKANLEEPEIFFIIEDHLIVRCKEEDEYALMLTGGP